LQRLAEYMARSPFSLARLVRITPEGKVIYRADKEHCRQYPLPAEPDLFGGVARNFQIFEPLDFLAELTQHIPNQGEHLIRYYGSYSNKARNGQPGSVPPCRKTGASSGVVVAPPFQAVGLVVVAPPFQAVGQKPDEPPAPPQDKLARRRWARLIKRIYHTDPLLCPKCGGTMRIVSFIEARQEDLIRDILKHCGLWHDAPPRAPPKPANNPCSSAAVARGSSAAGNSVEIDPDYLEHLHHEQFEQPDLPWDDTTTDLHA